MRIKACENTNENANIRFSKCWLFIKFMENMVWYIYICVLCLLYNMTEIDIIAEMKHWRWTLYRKCCSFVGGGSKVCKNIQILFRKYSVY